MPPQNKTDPEILRPADRALFGLALHGRETGKRQLIGTRIEHKAVLEPLDEMAKRGFEVIWINCDEHGRVRVDELEGL